MKGLKRFLEEIVIVSIVLYVHWEVYMPESTKQAWRYFFIGVFLIGVIQLLRGG